MEQHYLQCLYAVDEEQFAQFFFHPLQEIFQTLQRYDPLLNESELKYVHYVLLRYRGIPINMATVAELVSECNMQNPTTKRQIVAAETTLLMLGLFQPEQGFYRRRSAYPAKFYAETAKGLFWNIGKSTGKPVYYGVADNFDTWTWALAALAETFRQARLDHFLVSSSS